MGSNSTSRKTAYESAALPYLVAAISTLAALGLRMLLDPVLRDQGTYLTFFLAVVAASRFGGFLPGVVATALSALSLDWFLIEPRASLDISSSKAQIGLALFCAAAVIISWVVGRLRIAAFSATARSASPGPPLHLIPPGPASDSAPATETPAVRLDLRQRPHVAWLGFAILLVVAEAVFFVGTWTRLSERERWSTHTHHVLEQLASVLSALQDTETGQRGYLLTGNDAYRQPYDDAARAVLERLNELRNLTSDNPAQQKRAEALRTLVAAKLDEQKDTIYLRSTKGAPAALEVLQADQGKQLMDRIRNAIADMRTTELSLLDQRNTSLLNDAKGMVVVMLSGIGLLVLVLVGGSRAIDGHSVRRAQSERELRAAMERYEGQVRLFDGVASTTPDFVYLFDRQGRFLYANRRLLEVLGMQLPEVTGKTCRELGYEQWHHDMHMREIAEVVQTRRTVKGEVPFKAPRTGISGVYEYIFTPVLGPDGEVEVIAGTTRDVTGRKQAEDLLRAGEKRYRTLFESMNEAVVLQEILTDETGAPRDLRYLAVNPAFERQTGIKPEHFVGRKASELFPESVPEWLGRYEQMTRSGAAQHYAEWFAPLDRWLQSTLFPTEPGQFGHVLLNITERKQAEEQLRRSEEKFARAFAVNPAAVAITRLEDGYFLDVNGAWEAMTGYSREEVKGRSAGDFNMWPAPADRVAFVAELKETGLLQAREQVFVKKGGATFTALFSAVIVDVGGEKVVLSTLLDATAQKRTQEALRQSEARFRALVTATSEVVYRMSPDWNEMRHLRSQDFVPDTEPPSGDWLRKYVHPEDQPRVLAAIGEAIRTKSTFALEHRVLRVDGSVGWTFSRAIPVENGNGEITEWFGAASDITQRKEAEQGLQDREDQFRTLANAIPQLCWTAKADGWIDWYNDRWYRYTGTTPRQMEGWGWQSVHDPVALPQVMERWQASIATGQPFDMVFPLRASDGVFHPFLTRVMPVLDREGKVARWFGTNTDVTEQQQAEDALRTQANLLRLSFDAIILWHLDGGIESWNIGAERLYGFSEKEAVGRVTHDLLSTVFPKPFAEIRTDLLEKGSWEGELRHRTRDGHEVIVSARKQLIRDAHGVERVLETNRDITQQKSAQEALLASNSRFRSVFQNAAAGILLADWEGRVLESNEAFCKLLGYTPKELAGRHFSTLIPREDLELNLADTRRLKAGELHSFQNESRYLRKDGQTIWVQKSVSLIPDSAGGLTNVVVLATDISERKRAEAALRESEYRLRMLGDNLPNGALYRYREDPAGRAHVDFISAGIEGITGVPPAEYMADGATVDRNILPEDLERLRAAIARSRDELSQFELEVRHKHRATGEARWSLLRSTPTRLPDGSTAWDGIEIDVTERKRAEEKLRRSEARMRAVFRSLTEGIVFLNPQGEIEEINESVERVQGLSLQELSDPEPALRGRLIRTDGTLFPKDEIPGIVALRTGQPVRDVEVGVPARDGGLRWKLVNAQPVRDEQGNLLGAVASFFDITDRKEAEEARKKSEERFRIAQELSPDGFTILRPVRDAGGRVADFIWIYENDAIARMNGTDPQAVLGRRLLDVFPSHRGTQILKIYQEVAETGERRLMEAEYHGDSIPAPTWFRLAVVPAGGDIAVLAQDITGRKESEARLRASEEKFAKAFATNPAGLAITRLENGIAIDVNDAWQAMTGYNRDEAIGQSTLDLHIWPAPEARAHYALELREQGFFRGREMTLQRKSGETYTALVSAATLAIGGENVVLQAWLDISDRKKAERALAESEERLRMAQQAARVGTFDWNIQTGLNTWTPELERLYGLPPGGFDRTQSSWENLVHPEDRAGAVERIMQAVENGEPGGAEFRVVWPDGSVHWLAGYWQVFKDESGAPLRLAGVNIDITTRKEAEEELKRSENRFRSVFENAAVGIAITDWDGRFQQCNAAYAAMLGYTVEELVSMDVPQPSDLGSNSSLIHPQDRAANQEKLLRLKAGEWASFEIENRYVRKDGQTISVHKFVSTLPGRTGEPAHIFALVTDITARRRAEAALAESEQRYRGLFETMQEAFTLGEVIFDEAGKPCDWRYLDVNPYFESIYGLKREEVVGKTYRSVLPGSQADYWIEIAGRVSLTGQGEPFASKSNTGRYLEGTVYRPQPGQFAAIVTDATARREAEDQIRRLNVDLEDRVRDRTAQLEAANTELEAFAYSVSHDLRAPLRGIDGWSLALVEDYANQLDQQAREYLGRVRSEAQRMGQLIDDMLQLSRITRAQMEKKPVDLTAVATAVAKRLRESHLDRRIEFVIPAGLAGKGDAGLLEIALTNLLGNSVKFTGRREDARIELGTAEIDGERAFFVRDNGVGFNMASAGKLFGAFQRLHKASLFPGTGIGLATVQRIIHRHGGRVWADAERGKGATFYFTLDSK